MERTQVYLSRDQRTGLASLATRSGKNKSELIREAVDGLLAREAAATRKDALARVAGMWRDRDDLPDPAALRRELDRTPA